MRAFDAPYYAIHQIQVSSGLQLFAFRRIYPSRHVVEKESYAEPVVLWDSNNLFYHLCQIEDSAGYRPEGSLYRQRQRLLTVAAVRLCNVSAFTGQST